MIRNILLAGVSAMGILALVGTAQAEGSIGQQYSASETSGSKSGAAAGSLSASGAAAGALNNARIGDDITNNSKTDAQPAIAPNLAGLYASPMACMGTSTASVGIGGVFSAGAGSTYQDDECNKREAVKLAAQLGLKGAAAAVFYDINVVKDVIGTATNADEVARAEAQALAGVQIADTVSPKVTRVSNTSGTQPRSNRPYWCSTIDSNNARWDECQ